MRSFRSGHSYSTRCMQAVALFLQELLPRSQATGSLLLCIGTACVPTSRILYLKRRRNKQTVHRVKEMGISIYILVPNSIFENHLELAGIAKN
jgi:hypothetical protein